MEFPAVGLRDNNSTGTLNNNGTNGYYWSSVQYDSNNAYNMNFNSSSVNPNNWNNKKNGFSVRCVRQEFTTLIFSISANIINRSLKYRQCRVRTPSRNAFVNVCSLKFAHLEFPAVGNRNSSDGTLNEAGTNGRYWSSVQSTSNTNNAYNLNFNSSSVSVNSNNKQNGRSVRCVRQEFTTLIFSISANIINRSLKYRQCRVRTPSRNAFVNVCSLKFAHLEFPAVGNRNTDSAGTLNNNGTNGYYWSSVQSSSNNAHNMNFNSSSVNMNTNNKQNGFSVRCVRREFTTRKTQSGLRRGSGGKPSRTTARECPVNSADYWESNMRS